MQLDADLGRDEPRGEDGDETGVPRAQQRVVAERGPLHLHHRALRVALRQIQSKDLERSARGACHELSTKYSSTCFDSLGVEGARRPRTCRQQRRNQVHVPMRYSAHVKSKLCLQLLKGVTIFIELWMVSLLKTFRKKI